MKNLIQNGIDPFPRRQQSKLRATETKRRVASGTVSDDDSVSTLGGVTVSSDLTEFDLDSDMLLLFDTQQGGMPLVVLVECHALSLLSLRHWLLLNDI